MGALQARRKRRLDRRGGFGPHVEKPNANRGEEGPAEGKDQNVDSI